MSMFSPFGAIKVGAGSKPGEEGKKPEQLKSLDKPAEKISGPSAGRRARSPSSRRSWRLSSLSSRSSPTIGSRQRSALDACCGALANQSAPPMERSRRATRMPMVKPATTSISEATITRKNTDVAAWLTTRNSTMQATNTIIDKP